jgi:diguanylate cyclase (GGDEF)-like protein
LSASFAYNSPVQAMRGLPSQWRLISGMTVFAFVVASALIVNGSLSIGRAILLGIAAFAAVWAAAIFAGSTVARRRTDGVAWTAGVIATLVAILCVTASLNDDGRARIVIAALGVSIAVMLWIYAVVNADRSAGFDASVATLALLMIAVGLLLIPPHFEEKIHSDAGGLLIATLPSLAAAALITRRSRRGVILLLLIAVVAGLLIVQPDDLTSWLIGAAIATLLAIADSHLPARRNRTILSFTGTDAVLFGVASTFLGIYLAFSINEPVRGFQMGALAALAVAVTLVQRLIIDQRDERMLELATLTAQYRERAQLDSLTDLPNRAALDSRLLEEVERAVRYRHPMSLCFIDIDHFKAINDNAGHQVGDAILRGLAEVLQATVRTPDFVARYGGEEFVVIAPGTWSADAAVLGRRIQAAVARGLPQPLGRPISVSIGIAGVPEHGREASAVLRVADIALYAAKRAGRNRVEIGATHETSLPT